MRRRRGICLLLLGGWLAAHAAPAAADTPYRIEFAGIAKGPVLDTLKADSQLVALAGRPPTSPAALRRRAEDDIARLAEAMRAEGYWQATVAYRLDTTQSPALATITVTQGPLFHMGKVAFVLTTGAPAALIERMGAAAFGLAPGAPALSAAVAAANARIVATYGQTGYPFAAVRDRHVTVDVATRTMAVTYTIDLGASAKFGATTIAGLRRVNRDFVTRRIAWKEGAPYDERQVAATREALVRAGLFSAVRVEHDAAPAADGTVAMSITLIEGAPRSIGAGAGYNTNLGFGTRAFWEHRNLFGEGEDLRFSAGVAQRQLGVALSFRRPDFLKPKLDLLANAEVLHETTDAYSSRRWRIYTGLEDREFAPYAIGSGVSLERAYLTETNRDENYLLLGAPLYVRRDTTDDLLDPTKGTRATLTFTPYHGLLADDVTFFSTRVEGSAYQRLGDTDRYVLAGYAAVGSIIGASLEDVPADKRLYAGGAGSVRGYAYQLAGPLDSSGVPIGGRSSLEFGGELRYRITPTIGIVPFVDAGNVFPAILPDRMNLFYSAGLGLRYYTAIGPIRLDLAFPLEKRASDGAVQVYISIGQAF